MKIWRSAGWPSRDPIDIDLLAAGLVSLVGDHPAQECLRLTEAGIAVLAQSRQAQRRAESDHDKLALRMSDLLTASGRLVWRELSLRAQVEADASPQDSKLVAVPCELSTLWGDDAPEINDDDSEGGEPTNAAKAYRWRMTRPDLFSVRRTSNPAYLQPMVHEVKVSFGPHSLFDWTPEQDARFSTLCIRNVLPGPFLKPRLGQAHSVTLFSATLQPTGFFETMLGTPDNTVAVEVASPFSAKQLEVKVARHISTRYQDRARSRDALTALMAEQYRARPGNYLAFFSSHDYLLDMAAHFAQRHPDIPIIRQSRGMSEAAQRDFLQRMTPTSQGIGFAVLGGSFSEGVDLPGQRLIGAFIATLGLPQVNAVNEHFKRRLDDIVGDGHAFTYLYPGLQKVVQAAGRVIRTTTDQGVVHLLDDRYLRADIRALLPRWWSLA